MAAFSGRLALLAAAVALQGLAVALTAPPAGSSGKAGVTTREEIHKWLDEAAKANDALDKETQTVMDDIVHWMREDKKGKEEQELEMIEALLSKWDAENETSVDETARRMAAVAFRRELRALFGRPGKKAARRSSQLDASQVGSVDESVRAWMDEVMKATDALDKEARAEESDLGEPVPKSAEEKDLEKLESLLDSVDPKNASEMSEVGESLVTEEFRRFVRDRFGRPGHKGLFHRHRRLPPAPPATPEQRAAVRQEMGDWLPGAEKEASDLDEAYNSVDKELDEQIDNITREQELSAIVPEADKELAVLQGIWDKYELGNENVSAEDVTERLYPENGTSSNGTWEEGAANDTEPPEPEPAKVAELRQEVERLQAEVDNVTEQVKEADAAEPPALQLRRLALRRRAVEALSAALDDGGHRR